MMNRVCLLILACVVNAAFAVDLDCIDPFDSEFAEAGFVAATDVVDVAAADGLALGATSTAVLVLDVTDPLQPTLLATWTVPMGEVVAVALDHPWGVVACDDGVLHVLDLTDPAAPVALPAGDAGAVPIVALDLRGDVIGVVAGPQTARVFQIEADAAPVAR